MVAVYLYRSNYNAFYCGFCAMEKIVYRSLVCFIISTFSGWNCPQWVKGDSLGKQDKSDKQFPHIMCYMFVPALLLCYSASWEHSFPSLQKATCLQNSFTFSWKSHKARKCCHKPHLLCIQFPQWPSQGNTEQRGMDRWLWFQCWAAKRFRSKGTVLATGHAA